MTKKEALNNARDYIREGDDRLAQDCLTCDFDDNYYGNGSLTLLGEQCDIESIWTDNDDAEPHLYIHVCHQEFEGDILFTSLTAENQTAIVDMLYNYHVKGIQK